jgi:hypothetical protein
MTRRILWTGLMAAALAAGHAQAATSVHALTISGQAKGVGVFGCATSGPLPSTAFYGQGVPVPAEGHAGCSLAGGIQDVSHAVGPSMASLMLSNTFNGALNTASADAFAEEGALGVSATETYGNGFVDSRSYMYSEAGAMFSDDDLDSGMTGVGYIRLRLDIDGAMAVTGNGDALTRLVYQINAEPIYTAFAATLGHGTSFIANGLNGSPFSGFTTTSTSITGADTAISFYHLVDFANFDLKVGLYTAAYGAPNGSALNDFFHTAKLGGIDAYDLFGNPLDLRFTGASGTIYDATGAHRATAAVPEPSQWALMILGFGLVGLLLRQPGRRLDPRRATLDRQVGA